MNSSVVCPETITIENGVPACSASWVVVQSVPDFHPSQLDSSDVGAYFGAGFTLWFAVWLIRLPLLHTVTAVLNLVNVWGNPRG